MDKQRIRYLLARYWWLIVLSVAASVLGSYAWLQRQASVYSANAVVEVAQSQDNILAIASVKNENPGGGDYITTVAESLTGAQVMLESAKATGLYEELKSGGLTESTIVAIVKGKVSVRWRRGTRLIDVSVNDVDPVRAQKLANTVVAKYLERSGEQRSTVSGSAGEYLRAQADRLKEELTLARKKVADYRMEHKDVPLDEQAAMLAAEAKELSNQRLQVAAARLQLEGDLTRISQAKGDEDALLQIASLAALPTVGAARSRFMQEEANFDSIKETYLELHPKYTAAQQRVISARRALGKTLAGSTSVVQAQLEDAIRREKHLAEAQTTQTAGSQQLTSVLTPYQLLAKEAEAVQKMYDTVTQRISELGVKDPTADKSPVFLVESAMLPVNPIWPVRQSMLTRAAFMGFLGACALLFLIDRMDNSYQTVEQVESDLNYTVLAAIPDNKVERKKVGDLPMADALESLQAEAYRTLRTSISMLGEESQRRAILVTSAMPGEGKSRTSANLAIAFAQQGFSTLLIDADLRRPAQRRLFFPNVKPATPEESFGLAEYLSDLATADSIIRPSPVANLSIALAGRKCPSPAEVLSQPNTGKFINEALFKFDRVVIDSAPINSVADTLAIVPHVHYVCLVIRACRTPRREVKRALEFLGRSGAKMAGVALNRLPQRVYGYYYNYKSDPYLTERDA